MSAKSKLHASRWVGSIAWLALTVCFCITLRAGDPDPEITSPPATAALNDQDKPDSPAAETTTPEQPENLPSQLIVVRLSPDLFRPLIEKPIDQTGPVDEVVLGTRAIGKGRIVGQPTLELIEDPDRAGFRVVFRGTTVSRTVGRNGPAIIHTRTETAFAASKRVDFEPGKGFYATPAKINANTQSFTEGIETTRRGLAGRIVERRAWEAVNANRPTVTEIARERACKKICAAFDKRLDERLAELNKGSQFQQLILALRGPEPIFRCCSTPNYLQFAIAREKGAPWPTLPTIPEKDAPVQVFVHKTLLDPELLATLRRANRVRSTITELIQTALITVPTSTDSEPPKGEEPQPAVDYYIVEDWVVVRLGVEPNQDVETTEAKAATQPTIRR